MNNQIDVLLILPSAIGDSVAHSNIINAFLTQEKSVAVFSRSAQTIYDDYPNILQLRTLEQLTSKRFRILIDTESLPANRWVIRAAKAELRIGGRRRNLFNLLYYHKRIERMTFGNIYRDLLPFAMAAGIPEATAQDWSVQSYSKAQTEIGEVGIHLDASNALRDIPERLVQQICDLLIQKKIKVRILGQDKTRIGRLLRDFPDLIYTPLALSELKYVLKSQKLVIAPDSGIAHLAAALGTRLASFHGPTLSSMYAATHVERLFEKQFPCRPCDQTKPCPYEKRCLNTIDFTEVAQYLNSAIY